MNNKSNSIVIIKSYLKVLVHGEGDGDGSLLHELLLDVGNALDGVRGSRKVLVGLVSGGVIGLRASGRAFGSGIFGKGITRNHAGGGGDVVSA